jgi:hypothetical protein
MGFGKFLVGGIVSAAAPTLLPAAIVAATGAFALSKLSNNKLAELSVRPSPPIMPPLMPRQLTEPKKVAPERVARKCSSCSAPISGIKGQVVCCHYCDSDQQL